MYLHSECTHAECSFYVILINILLEATGCYTKNIAASGQVFDVTSTNATTTRLTLDVLKVNSNRFKKIIQQKTEK